VIHLFQVRDRQPVRLGRGAGGVLFRTAMHEEIDEIAQRQLVAAHFASPMANAPDQHRDCGETLLNIDLGGLDALGERNFLLARKKLAVPHLTEIGVDEVAREVLLAARNGGRSIRRLVLRSRRDNRMRNDRRAGDFGQPVLLLEHRFFNILLRRVVAVEQLDEIVLGSERSTLLSNQPIHLIGHGVTLPNDCAPKTPANRIKLVRLAGRDECWPLLRA